MNRALTRFWAQLVLAPQRLRQLQRIAIGCAVVSTLLLGIGFVQLNRIRTEADSYRAEALMPAEQNQLPPEKQAVLKEIQQIAATLTSTPNAQAFAISRLSQIAYRQGLTLTGVETADAPNSSGQSTNNSEWHARLLRFRVSGSSQQVLRWLQSLEAVPLVIRLTGVQIAADTNALKGVNAVVEMELLLPPSRGGVSP